MEVKARGNVLGSFMPARYILTILCSIGLAIVYGMNVNLSTAMIGMLNHTALRLNYSGDDDFHNFTDDVTHESDRDDGPFIWTSDVQGIILSGYYWGYFISQIPAGRMAELFSAKWVLFFSVAITSVCTLLLPVMAETHYFALTFMRFLQGISGGATLPAIYALMSKWCPPAERSFIVALAYSGAPIGIVVAILMTGILTSIAGWPSSFYVSSGLSTIWCLLWVVLIQDTPQKQSFISVQERNMIIVSLGGNVANHLDNEKLPVPWRAIFSSPPFLAILLAHTCCNWGWFMVITEVPFYMKQIFHFNLAENTFYGAPPYFTLWIFSTIFSKTVDWLRGRRIITTTTARKIGTLCGSGMPSLCLLALCFIGNNPAAAVVIMAVAITAIGGQNCGAVANHIDIAPNFAGTLFGITSTVGTIPGMMVPIFVSAVTRDNQTIGAWRIVFLVTVGIYALGVIIFLIFGTGEEQPWNKAIADKDQVEKKENVTTC